MRRNRPHAAETENGGADKRTEHDGERGERELPATQSLVKAASGDA